MSTLTEIIKKLDVREADIQRIIHGVLTFKIQDGKVVLMEILNKYK